SVHGRTPQCSPRSSVRPRPPAAILRRWRFRLRPKPQNALLRIALCARQQTECPNQKSPAPAAASSTLQFHPAHSALTCRPSAPATANPLLLACKCRRRSSPSRGRSVAPPAHRPCPQCSSRAVTQNAGSSLVTSPDNLHSRSDGLPRPRFARPHRRIQDTSLACETSCVRGDGRRRLTLTTLGITSPP